MTGRLGIAAYRSGDVRQAVTVLRTLEGREVENKELAAEVNQVIEEVNQKARSGASSPGGSADGEER